MCIENSYLSVLLWIGLEWDQDWFTSVVVTNLAKHVRDNRGIVQSTLVHVGSVCPTMKMVYVCMYVVFSFLKKFYMCQSQLRVIYESCMYVTWN
jgi:hypothetical protein